ncbi:MAG TPA: sodium:calcium antiporter, partial [Methylotenera sp.]|nr:sodium:calcium antiporter [Methylotenera sp.]
ITGAMVFQGRLLRAIGIMLTPWEPRTEVVLGIGLTLMAAIWLRYLMAKGGIKVWHLLVNGAMYITYLVLVLS